MTWSMTVAIDPQIYPLQVAQKVAYALSPSLSILISQQDNRLDLAVTPTTTSLDAMLITETYAHTLITRSLNDFALREQVQRETAGLRELLATVALKEAGL